MPGKGNRKATRRTPQPDRRRGGPSDGAPPPLHRFSPDRLARFLELAFTPGELLSLCREVGAQPKGGYRLERLEASERSRLLADDYAEKPRVRAAIEAATVDVLKTPALRALWVTGKAASELAQLVAGDPVSAQARLAWRCIGDGDPAVRAVADQAIDHGMALLERFEDEAAQPPPDAKKPPVKVDEQIATIEKRLQQVERERDAARAQLQQARTEIADRDKRLNEQKLEATRLRVDAAAQVAELSRLQAAQSTDERRGATELRKLSAENAHLEGRLKDLEERLAVQARRSAELERALTDREKPPLNLPPGDPHHEAPAHEFVIPSFTPEFYDSVERWDRRVVKVAFEKALMLAKDHRHPSLRALPLTGVDNLFRIRIASDVRLIYRRGDDGRLEILSLIDREDLDRYVRQARTRREG